MERPPLKEILERHRDRLLALEGVHGVAAGVSRDDPARPCVIVYAETDEPPAGLPDEVEGYPVELHRATGFTAR